MTSVSGDPYDWTATRAPERPWRHAYHRTFVDKIYLATKPNPLTGEPARGHLTFEQALARIRQVDAVTRGMPKITYLVGWQYGGHDSKYPDWSEVNPRLKRPHDRSARDSLIWLMEEGARHNTTVSLHINMLDAYEDAPSWKTYLAAGALVRKDGQLYRHARAVWGGQQAYWIDYDREWETGLAQKRIDGLLALLPLREAGTAHIDAFGIPLHTDAEAQKAAMRRIFRYWRDGGVDITSESMFDARQGEAFIGLQPMAWHINPTSWGYSLDKPEAREALWMDIPAALYCGGVDWIQLETGQLFGTSMQGEGIAAVDDFRRPFCLQTLPWQYLNQFDRLRLEGEGPDRTLWLSEGVVSRVAGGRRTIRHGTRLVVDGDDVFVPAAWRPHREIIAHSVAGYALRRWELPPDWDGVARVDVHEVRTEGLRRLGEAGVEGGGLALSLAAGQTVSVVPGGTPLSDLRAPGASSRAG